MSDNLLSLAVSRCDDDDKVDICQFPPAALSEDGYYQIDACPRAFAVILNWFRYKEILNTEVHPGTVIPVVDYFGLPELCEKLEALKKPVSENNNDDDIIRLDVGGTLFKTSRGTMTQHPRSRLAEMFTPGSRISPPVKADGAYFIVILTDWFLQRFQLLTKFGQTKVIYHRNDSPRMHLRVENLFISEPVEDDGESSRAGVNLVVSVLAECGRRKLTYINFVVVITPGWSQQRHITQS